MAAKPKRKGYASGGLIRPLPEPKDFVGRLQRDRPGNMSGDKKMEVKPSSDTDWDDNVTMPQPDSGLSRAGKAKGGKVRKVIRRKR